MPSQADKNHDILKKILDIVEQQRKEILMLKQDIAYIKKQTDVAPEKISTGWLW